MKIIKRNNGRDIVIYNQVDIDEFVSLNGG
jgi:hypothetical protein